MRNTHFASFLKDYYRFALPEEIPSAARDKEGLARSQLRWAENRRRGRIKVRVFNPTEADHGFSSTHTIIETITDDSPFIVDSLTMRINASSQGVLVKLHSVFDVERDADGRLIDCRPSQGGRRKTEPGSGKTVRAESWTHFEIPRILQRSELRALKNSLTATLGDVKTAVRDWPKMLAMLRQAGSDLKDHGKDDEGSAFLDWLADDHFTLLGYCELPKGSRGSTGLPRSSFGLLRSAQRRGVLADAKRRRDHMDLITITKSSIRSTVHRPAFLDDIRVTAYDESGRVAGEHRILGLFTSGAYNENPGEIPLLRAKIDEVMQRSGLDPVAHRGKALRHILDTFPRDALIQIPVEDLESISLGILSIEERRTIRLFWCKSAYGDFFSCIVYLPRDGYSGRVRSRVESVLTNAFDGKLVDSQLTVSESILARLALTIHRTNPDTRVPDIARLQSDVQEAALSWIDRARIELVDALPEDRALALHGRLASLFPVAYQETIRGARLCRDFAAVAALLDGDSDGFFELVPDGTRGTFTTMLRNEPIPLYVAERILDNMGVKLLQETSYALDDGDRAVWIQDFVVGTERGESLSGTDVADRFEACFRKTLDGAVENDSFNSLVVAAGLDWRQAVVLRAYCKYLLQGRAKFSQDYMLGTLRRYPNFVAALAELFAGHFDPAVEETHRAKALTAAQHKIRAALDDTTSLDDDRILRMFDAAIQATLRTNFYQTANGSPKPYLSFKFDPARIAALPEPRPKFEIFVYSPTVEGVHLRGGRIARGGLRWSNRREDFRTEVLGLMKAQQVKNTVIVPSGAKGGFVCKGPAAANPETRHQIGIECYRVFLRGLLDVTDNIVSGKTAPPPDVVCRDEPDPYLVVAADKGTATFSDTANAVAAEYGFWLADAFASGGSAGYDHKKMGITARGAWESVKRHCREIGIDAQRDAISVAGIGDMSGDVFGNGMLLSDRIRLVAAFNHKHIFIDPDPDPAPSFAERQRLFALSRSGWDDYDAKLLSQGGGIYERQSKSIKLSPQARAALGIDRSELTPPELISAILLAPVDLLWNGGIGTYVKASAESHSDAADPANDSVRVDGRDLRCRIIAEGGNLGLTQRGRVEFALAGGRINTDFIDNSAGVDSSDREVNIKILLNDAIRDKVLSPGRRNALLAAMTGEIAELVLANNYAQTQTLSMMASQAHERLGEHGRLIRLLEARGLLNRSIEFLPNEEEIDERKRGGRGFTRPELAVILSYAKIELFDSLIATDIPDEEHCQSEVFAYFPKRLAKRFPKQIRKHRLRREIAAMLISSSMINRMGPYFPLRAQEDTGANLATITRAYAIVRALFETRQLWRDIESLDGKVQSQVQYDCFYQCSRMFRRSVYWVLHRRAAKQDIANVVASKAAPIATVRAGLPDALCGLAKRIYERDTANFESLGLPRGLAQRIAGLRFMTQILDIAELSSEFDVDAMTVARLHFELGRGLRLDWIRSQIEDLRVEGHWRALARSTLRETLGREQRVLLERVLHRSAGTDPGAVLAEWLADTNAAITRLKHTLDEMQSADQMDFATLSIALKEISRLH